MNVKPDCSLTATCLNCKVEFKYRSRQKTGKFCSNKCQQELKSREMYAAWIAGEPSYISSNSLRKAVHLRDGHSCSSCQLVNWRDKPIALELEHKNGNSSDNSPANLCLLCPNCHSQTSTYKGRNKGNGRHSRRERYSQGLSY